MSHFLCGEISFRGNEPWADLEYDARLFRLIEAAAKRRLCVQFGANINQKIVFDIIGSSHDNIQLSSLPFLALGSPVSNTSDELFYPPSSSFSPKERIEHLKSRVDEVISWVNRIFDEPSVIGVCIYLSEGYDTNYDQKECAIGDFQTTLQQTLLRDEFVPSTKIVIGSVQPAA
ncbi:hypothetical protein [Bradyrhizobium sp. sBnM-33]|uniref:hypothetical protein n=1 Tax=Bradyrhizobium sp. sBnM-33 TaxID=2831780 RepID=UPI001BCB8190|nr:hypothetical protein [Bradyrhizobium sp. sBnM-33]WOH49072.1 hypothetical protein RX328_34100 [Bradyrhizobium sp. sBnM-33]